MIPSVCLVNFDFCWKYVENFIKISNYCKLSFYSIYLIGTLLKLVRDQAFREIELLSSSLLKKKLQHYLYNVPKILYIIWKYTL